MSEMPFCMQDGWNPNTPGNEYRDRVLDAAQEAFEQGDLEERDRLLALIEESTS